MSFLVELSSHHYTVCGDVPKKQIVAKNVWACQSGKEQMVLEYPFEDLRKL
jgi:hypothetical protein